MRSTANAPSSNAIRRRVPLPGFLFVVATLLVSMPLVTTGNMYVGSLVAVILSSNQVAASTIGLVLTMHSIGFVTGTLFASKIVRAVGHIRAFSAFAALTCIFALAYPLETSPVMWGALRLAGGLTIAGLLTVMESWVAARSTSATRGKLLAAYAVLYYLSAVAGQLLIAVSDLGSFVPFTVAAMLIAGSMVPLVLGRTEAPAPTQHRKLSLRSLLRKAPLGTVGAFAGGTASSAFFNIGPVFAWSIGLGAEGLALFMACGLLGAMSMQVPVGWAADRFGRARLFGIMLGAGIGASGVAAAVASFGGWVAYVMAALYMGCATTIYPLSVGDANERLDVQDVLPAAGTLLLSFGLGTVAGPLGASATLGLLGPPGLFVFTTLVLIAFALFAAARAGARAAQQRSARYVPLADGSTQVLTDLRAGAVRIKPGADAPVLRPEDEHTVPDGWR